MFVRSRSLLAVVPALALLARPAPAHACSCASPGIVVTPGPGVVAPTNTEVRLTWDTSVKVDESTITLAPAAKPAKPAKAKKKGKAGSHKNDAKVTAVASGPVDVDRVAVTAAGLRVIILRPRTPLSPRTKYQVTLAAPGGGKAAVVREFETGADVDTTAPTWPGVAKTRYVHDKAVCCNCSTGLPWIGATVAGADQVKDDKTPNAAIWYGVWSADGTFDAKSPPLTIAQAWGDTVYLGHKSMCSPANLDVAGTGPLRVRIAPIDLAGNAGTPAEVTIDRAPAMPPKPGPPKPGVPPVVPGKPGVPPVVPGKPGVPPVVPSKPSAPPAPATKPAPTPGPAPAPAPAPAKPAPTAPAKPAPGPIAPAPTAPTAPAPTAPAPTAPAPTAPAPTAPAPTAPAPAPPKAGTP
jgi:hypothetical protein